MIRINKLKWKNCKNFNIHAFERLNERNISFNAIKNLSWYIYDRKVSNVTGLYSINELHNYTANVCIVIDWLNVSEFDVITVYPLSQYKRAKGLKKLKLRY